MVLVGIILGKVMFNIGFIPLDIKEFISGLCGPLNITGALLLSWLSLHISWICNGFKLSVSNLLCSIFIILLFTFFKVGISGGFSPLTLDQFWVVLNSRANYLEYLGLVGLFDNIIKIPAGIRAISLGIRANIDNFYPMAHMMETSAGSASAEATSGSSTGGPSRGRPSGATSGPSTGGRTKADQDKAFRTVYDSLKDRKTRFVLHPDMAKQAKANIAAMEKMAIGRDLTLDEVVSLSMFRRKLADHHRGLEWLETKSKEQRERFYAKREKIWQTPELIADRRAFYDASRKLTQPVSPMNINNIINR